MPGFLPNDPRYVIGELPEVTPGNVMQTVAVDFDGVIHAYTKGWCGGKIYDPPVKGAREAIKKLRERGYIVIVHTACSRPVQDVMDWLVRMGIEVDAVSNIKPPAIAYIDDRGIRFTNWVDILKYFA